MKEVISTIYEEDNTAFEVWLALAQQLLPNTVEKEGNLKNMLVGIKKGSCSLEEYLREFKSICDNLAAIKKPVLDLDKVFQFADGLGGQYLTFRTAMLTKATICLFQSICHGTAGS